MTASQEKALRELWPVFGVPADGGRLDFARLFGRHAAVVLDIGFGNGDTLVAAAAKRPDQDFVGVEVHEPGIGHCLIETKKAGIDNLRIVCQDAIEVLRDRVPAASLSRINLLFPDPWPKKRHHKRRLLQAPFVALAAAALEPGGSLFVATDWSDYANHIDELMADGDRFVLVERREHGGDRPLDRTGTKFERRGLGKGHRIVDWHFRRIERRA